MRERQEAIIFAEVLLKEALVGAGRRVAGRELKALQAREERGDARLDRRLRPRLERADPPRDGGDGATAADVHAVPRLR